MEHIQAKIEYYRQRTADRKATGYQTPKIAPVAVDPIPISLGLCIYEGAVTEPCRSCSKGGRDVRLCLHPDPSDVDRDVCTRQFVSDKVQSCDRCQDKRTVKDPDSFVARYDHTNLAPSEDSFRFNASILDWKKHYLLAYRTGWAGSEIMISHLGRDWQPIPQANHALELRTSGAFYGREDPRLFVFRDQPHCSFAGVVGANNKIIQTNILYARLHPDTLNVQAIYTPTGFKRQKWEKNWVFFQHRDDLYALYLFHPRHQVLRIDGNDAQLVIDLPSRLTWNSGTIRGGAPPIRVGDELWHFFHDRVEHNRKRVYRMGLVTYEPSPPFRQLRYITHPILTANPETKPPSQYCSVVFPCGAVVRDQSVYVSMGVHDRWIELHRWAISDLESRLIAVN